MTAFTASLPTATSSLTSPNAQAASVDALSPPSRKAIWAGRVLSGLAVLFLAFDAVMKLLQVPAALEGTAQLGYPSSVIFGVGVLEAILLIAYVVPRTTILGALLWVGYLGGAVATHVRVGNPLGSHILFPIYVAILLCGGLWLRQPRVRALFRRA